MWAGGCRHSPALTGCRRAHPPPSGPGATPARGRRGNGRRRRCGPGGVRTPGAGRVPPRPPSPTLGCARAGGTPITLGAPPRPLRHWGRHECPRMAGRVPATTAV
ncbi:hypothetical protein SAM9427_10060 [Streptomyces sp. ETH9427]|nr:hypothetical protein SAM9427_10060 [Streptomyces sp. ETH9427]